VKSAVIKSRSFFISHGLGIHPWSIRARATPCSRRNPQTEDRANFISNLDCKLVAFGSFFKNGFRSARNSAPLLNFDLLKYPTETGVDPACHRGHPSFQKMIEIIFAIDEYFFVRDNLRHFAAKMNPDGVFVFQLSTVESAGVR